MFLKKNVKRIINVIFVTALFAVTVTGCGKKADPKLEAYKESMTSFYEKLAEYDSSINSINAET